MNFEKSFSAPTITESGVRRIGQSLLDRLKKRFIPYRMAPRKHEEREVDPSVVAWRSFQTLASTAMIALGTYIATHVGSPDMSGVQGSLDRLNHRMEVVEEKVDMMRGRVDVLQSAVNGLKQGAHL